MIQNDTADSNMIQIDTVDSDMIQNISVQSAEFKDSKYIFLPWRCNIDLNKLLN